MELQRCTLKGSASIDFSEEHLLDGCIEDEGETPCVRNVGPLVSPTEGDRDLRPREIARVGGGVFRIDGEHMTGGELPFSSTIGGGEAPKDGGDYLVVILEDIVIAPRWSAASGSIVVVVVWLFGLELLS